MKLLEDNIQEKLFDIGLGPDFLAMTLKAQTIKEKIRQAELHLTKNLHSKGNNQKSQKTTYRMGENICKPHA